MLSCMRKEYSMNINSISNTNFNARISDRDYHYNRIKEILYYNHGVDANDVIEFEKKLEKLPAGNVIIDEYINHADKDYVFGTVYPPCGHEKPFVIETHDTGNMLDYILENVKAAFVEKSKHPECPICNPETNTL